MYPVTCTGNRCLDQTRSGKQSLRSRLYRRAREPYGLPYYVSSPPKNPTNADRVHRRPLAIDSYSMYGVRGATRTQPRVLKLDQTQAET